MKTINKIKNELNLDIKKVSLYNNIKYVETDKGNYIIKKAFDNKVFRILEKNNFNNYIGNIKTINGYNVFNYIDDIQIDVNERALDLITLMSKLHKLTNYYKNITIIEIKEFYEEKINYIKDLTNYYDYLRFIIEEKKHHTTTDIYFLKNLSIIYMSLDLVTKYVEEWYLIMKEKNSIRYSLIHNNLNLSHIIENDSPFFISCDIYKYDIPIYDFINFYKKDFKDLDFLDLFNIYKNNINLSKEEILLTYIELLMPKKIILEENDLKNIYELTYQNIYLNKTYFFVSEDNKIN